MFSVHQLVATVAVYGSGFYLGLLLVSVPALSVTLQSLGLSDAWYGLAFLPQVFFAVVGSAVGPLLGRRLGLRGLLLISLAVGILTEGALSLFLATTKPVGFGLQLSAGSLGWLYGCTGGIGLAFGLAAAPVNKFPEILFKGSPSAAVVALHTAMGLGLAFGPIGVAVVLDAGGPSLFPTLLVFVGLGLLFATLVLPTAPVEVATATTAPTTVQAQAIARLTWFAVLYAFAEGTLSNWITLYLTQARGVPIESAQGALATFWFGMAGGRLLISALLLKFKAHDIWRILPFGILIATLLVPTARSSGSGIAVFLFAGLMCAGVFPLTISLGSLVSPARAGTTASRLTAALMIGVGIGTFGLGRLRSHFSFEWLYWAASVYPLAMGLLALSIRREVFVPLAPAQNDISLHAGLVGEQES